MSSADDHITSKSVTEEILMSNTNKLTRIDDLKKEQMGIKELLK